MTGTIYIRGVSVPVFCRIQTIVEVGIWLDPYIHAHAYDWLALTGGWCEDGGICDQWLRGEDGNRGIKTSPLKYSRELLLETRQLFWEMEVIKS